MKKTLLTLIIALAAIFTVSARDEVTRDISVLPSPARTYIDKNFKASVSFIKVDKTLGRVDEYEVILTDGSEVTFDRSGNWKEIEAPRGRSIPNAVMPEVIRRYVKANHKGTSVVGIERKGSGYEVELSDDTELRFDSAGNFIRYT